MNETRIITLTTDFGMADHYVAAMKGVILTINPEVSLVDICHEVSPYDILGGAITVAQACRYYPPGSVHVVVVDPGVGGARRAIVAQTATHVFVAPDNGVLTLALDRDQPVSIRHVVNELYFHHPVSNTFHGRDIFAPVAAHLSRGVNVDQMGPEISDPVRLQLPQPHRKGNVIYGSVLKIDKFGNVVTNITPEFIAKSFGQGCNLRTRLAGAEITETRVSYAGASPGALFAVFGSMGFLEIAKNQASAADELRAKVGVAVEVTAH